MMNWTAGDAADGLDGQVGQIGLEDWLASLMEQYGTDVQRLCCMVLCDYALAEDAAQETFLKAYRAALKGKLPDASGQKPWLLRIAVNTCKDARRTAWFRHVDRRAAPGEETVGAAGLDEAGRELFQMVLALPAKEKTAVFLHHYQGMNAEGIAQALGVSRATVYNRLKNAHRKLRAALEGDDWDA